MMKILKKRNDNNNIMIIIVIMIVTIIINNITIINTLVYIEYKPLSIRAGYTARNVLKFCMKSGAFP